MKDILFTGRIKKVTQKVIVTILLFIAIFCVGCSSEKIVWDDMILGSVLPEPPLNKGEIHTNSIDDLWVDIEGISDKQYFDYIEACKDKGFTIEAESTSYSYDAYNAEGYKLSLSHFSGDEDMEIDLEKPMELGNITWPTGTAGKKLPAPKSTLGEFSYEYDDHFFVYVGDMSKSDYDAYVSACSDMGFNVDYNKGDDYYYADNEEGWHISLNYKGYNIITISIEAPDESTESKEPTTSSKTEDSSVATNDNKDDTISPDFKTAMDSYEKFMDEYIEFMKKYKSNPTDLSLLADYANYMSDYADFVEDFDKWEDTDLNTAELSYYIDVQARVSKKLSEVAQ